MSHNLDFEKMKNYRHMVVGGFSSCGVAPACVLCATNSGVVFRGVWVNDEKERVVHYFLCESCGSDLFGMSKVDQQSIVEKVVEKRIEALLLLPHQKMSDLRERGFAVDL